MSEHVIKASRPPKKSGGFRSSEAKLGILLLAPTLALIGAVVIYPIFYNIILSFYKVSMNPKKPSTWIGAINYSKLFTDPTFYRSLFLTIVYVCLTVALSTLFGLLVALLMNRQFKGRKVARSLILFSYISPMIASVYAWQYMFNGLYGIVNYITVDVLKIFPEVPMWFDHPVYAVTLLVVFDVWRVFPYSFMMILASLQSIDQNLYEACDVDGASAWRKFTAITLPEILPAIGAVVILRTIWNFYKFDDIYLFTKSVPTIGVYLYQTAFASHDYGRASAITIILFGIIFSFVIFLGRKVIRR